MLSPTCIFAHKLGATHGERSPGVYSEICQTVLVPEKPQPECRLR